MAEQWARKTETTLDESAYLDLRAAQRLTVSELLDRYESEITHRKRSHRAEVSRFKNLRAEMGDVSLRQLTPEIVANYVHSRVRSGIKPETARKEINTLSAVLRTARSLWRIRLPDNPVFTAREILRELGTLKSPTSRDRRPTAGELERLYAALPGVMPLLVEFAIETGMRRGELARQRRVHQRGSLLDIPETKIDFPRTIPLSSRAQELLDEAPRRNVDDRVWGMQPDSITQAFNRACNEAEVKDLRFHDLRHEATSRFFEAGLSIPLCTETPLKKLLRPVRRLPVEVSGDHRPVPGGFGTIGPWSRARPSGLSRQVTREQLSVVQNGKDIDSVVGYLVDDAVRSL